MRKRIVGAAIVICGALGLPGAAAAVPTWSAANPLAEAGGQSADAAMGPNGDAAVTWLSSGAAAVQLATRAPLGSFSPALNLSPAGEMRVSRVAVDTAGDATVVWDGSVEKSNLIVESATVTNGIPSAPVKLSVPGQNAVSPKVAVNERGDAIVAWIRFNGSHYVVQASFRAAGGSFSAPVSLSNEGEAAAAESVKVAIDAAGDATVLWSRSNGGPEVVEEATRPASTGTFTAPVALSNKAESALQPSLAMDAEGDTAIVWIRVNGGGGVVQAVVRPAGGNSMQP